MIGVTKTIILLGACLATSFSCDALQAEEGEILSQPTATPVCVTPYPSKTTNPASPIGQQILIQAQLVEISLTKMRRSDIDFSVFDGQKTKKRTGLEILKETTIPTKFIEALCQNKIARILAAPKIAAYDNHLAALQMGSDVPFSTKQNDQQSADVGFVFIGTRFEVVPKMVDNQNVLLKIKLDWSKKEKSPADHTGAPHVRQIKMNTAIKAKLGETTLLSGSLRTVRQGDQDEEFAMILMVTPELAKRQPIEKRAGERIGQAAKAVRTNR